jgi:nucleoid DNA-binding protein
VDNLKGTGTTKIIPERQAVKFKPASVFKTAAEAV